MADWVAVGGLILGAVGTGISAYNWHTAHKDRKERVSVKVSRGSYTIRNLSVFPVEITSIRVVRPGALVIPNGAFVPFIMQPRTSQTFHHSLAETLYQQIEQVSVKVTTGTGKEFGAQAPVPTVNV